MSQHNTQSVNNGLPRRAEALARAKALVSIEVLIIGAGINGAGLFRDLALQGIPTLLVDKEDFGAGASMASSRMAHGGLRYLENGEFRLTAEATRERNLLLLNAPHLIKPMPVAIPFFSHFNGLWTALKKLLGLPASYRERGFVMAEIGLFIYDWFGRLKRSMPLHSFSIGNNVHTRFPSLHPNVKAFSVYYDALIESPERIALALVDEGMAACPESLALNHCAVESGESGPLILKDEINGDRFPIKAKLVVSAAGAWIDRVNGLLGKERDLIGGTKGSHLILDHPKLFKALAGHCMIFDDGQGRVCITYPIGDKVLLGATDIPITDPDQAICSVEEQTYLLTAIKVIFPDLEVGPEHVAFRFCGVRPLPKSNAANPGSISRDHSLVIFEPNGARSFPVFSMVGGKWTTFRAFAEQTTNELLKRLGKEHRVDTRRQPIAGASTPPDLITWADQFALKPARVKQLWQRYGNTTSTVCIFLKEGPDQPLPHCPD